MIQAAVDAVLLIVGLAFAFYEHQLHDRDKIKTKIIDKERGILFIASS
jgi:hypothetical protein